jgi:hypothetical protein
VLGALGCVSLYFDYHAFAGLEKAAKRAGMVGKVAKETVKFKSLFYFLLLTKGAVGLSMIISVLLLMGRFYNAHLKVIMVLGAAMLYNVAGLTISQFAQYSVIKATPGGLPRVISAQSSARGRKLAKRQQKYLSVLAKKLGKFFYGAVVMVAVGVTMLKCTFYFSLILFLTSNVVEEIYAGVPPPFSV